MTRFLTAFICLFSSVAMAANAQDPAYQCQFSLGRGCVSGMATVEIKDGQINEFLVDTYFCLPSGGHGFSCYASAKRGEKETQWQDRKGGRIRVLWKTSDPDDSRWVDVRRTEKSISIDLRKVWPDACSSGAALPVTVAIRPGAKTCAVQFNLGKDELRALNAIEPKYPADANQPKEKK